MAAAENFGSLFKRLRIERGYTLRGFCLEHGFDAGNLSKIERGRAAPPSETCLRKYAEALGIAEGSEAWQALLDQASAERGEVPADLLSDQDLVNKLPALFRTMRGQKADGDSLDRFSERIRQA